MPDVASHHLTSLLLALLGKIEANRRAVERRPFLEVAPVTAVGDQVFSLDVDRGVTPEVPSPRMGTWKSREPGDDAGRGSNTMRRGMRGNVDRRLLYRYMGMAFDAVAG